MSRRRNRSRGPNLQLGAPAIIVGNEDHQALLQAADDSIERAKGAKSKQPRFKNTDPRKFYNTVVSWLNKNVIEEPPYSVDSRTLDRWLMNIWHTEPHLGGVMYGAGAINKNRGWSLIGSKVQVNRYMPVLHDFQVTADVQGWRPALDTGSQFFYATDLGWTVETGWDGRSGPIGGLFHLDSTRCRLLPNNKTPLEYQPDGEGSQFWSTDDYFRIVSMPSGLERYRGLGWCAVSRAVELARLMIAVYQHDQEQLGARAPRGLLLLKNIQQPQWNEAMQARADKLEGDELRYYGAIAVIASSGVDDVDAKLVALSQLPQGFDLEQWTNLLMYGYALCFGYDPGEFWPVSFGALGRGTEADQQSKKATGKGGLDFCHELQEALAKRLPESVLFEFDERDDAGDLTIAEVRQAKADVIETLSKIASNLTPEQFTI